MAEEETLLDAGSGPNRGKPRLLGLWDQGIFTDALASAAQGHHVYPYTYSISPSNAIWSRLGWPTPGSHLTAANASRMHGVSWRPTGRDDSLAQPAWRRHAYRPRGMSAPPGNPQRRSWDGGEALHWQAHLLWLHLLWLHLPWLHLLWLDLLWLHLLWRGAALAGVTSTAAAHRSHTQGDEPRARAEVGG